MTSLDVEILELLERRLLAEHHTTPNKPTAEAAYHVGEAVAWLRKRAETEQVKS